MIRKNNKKVIPYNNDYEPTKVVQDNEVIFDYEKKTASGKEVSIVSEYKPKPKVEINGDESQVVKDVNVESVNGIGLKYNQLVKSINYVGYSCTISYDSNTQTRTITPNGINATYGLYLGSDFVFENNVYLCLVKAKCSKNFSSFNLENATILQKNSPNLNENSYSQCSLIAKATQTRKNFTFYISDSQTQAVLYINDLMIINLTDMFGSGNEPSTLEEFYATRQGKLYKSYVEYGYHILGAGEYLSNQLLLKTGSGGVNNGTSVSYDNIVDEIAFKTNPNSTQPNIYRNVVNYLDIKKDHVYLSYGYVKGTNGNARFDLWINNSGNKTNTIESNLVQLSNEYQFCYVKQKALINATSLSYLYVFFTNVVVASDLIYAKNRTVIDLTELGLDNLTLDELKAQRPDLFVPQPYHTTEKRIGIIFNDGSVDRLDYKKVKLKDLNFVKFGSTNNFYVDIPDMPLNTVVLSNKYSYSTSLSGDKIIWNQNYAYSSHNLVLVDRSYDNATDLKNSFTDDDYIEYKLANPQPLYAVNNDIKDEYKTNGVVNRPTIKIDLGTLNWLYNSSYGFYAEISNAKSETYSKNIICSKYETANITHISQLGNNQITQVVGFIGAGRISVNIKDNSYTDATAFKTAMSGVMLVYELATPTTELREPIAEDKVLPIVNEPYTQSVEQTPSPSYPREIEHTSKFKWNDLELPLDLYNGDKVIASRKVGKNIWEGLKYFQGLSYTSHYQYFKQGTYTISFHYQLLGTDTSNTTLFLDKGETRLSIFNSLRFTTNDYSYIFTINESGIYNVKLYCASVSGYLDNIMICLASEVDKTYEPYLKDKVMCLSKHKKITLTNAMTWYEWTDGTYRAGYKGYFSYDLPIAQNKKGICNRFVRSELAWGGYPVGFNFHGSYTSFNLKTSDMPTIQSWIEFITNNDVYVVYEDEPQWIDLTDSLGALLNDLTPNATQEFSVDNGTLQVDYYKAKE